MNSNNFSDYIIFVDESGDHGLQFIDKDYPIFVLVFVIIKKEDYINIITPAFQRFKYKYWGHDQVILHEREIRKEKEGFEFLRSNSKLRLSFYEELNDLIKNSNFEFIASIINKENLQSRYKEAISPYNLSMLFCMERLFPILEKNSQLGKKVHLNVEGRGAKENKELELEFRRICDNNSNLGYQSIDFTKISFDIFFCDKKSNSIGLQLADLIARPIGLNYLRADQINRAFDIIRNKTKQEIKIFP